MDEWISNVVLPYNELFLSLRKEENSDTCYTVMNFEDSMLSEDKPLTKRTDIR